jgi:hypothetical protein
MVEDDQSCRLEVFLADMTDDRDIHGVDFADAIRGRCINIIALVINLLSSGLVVSWGRRNRAFYFGYNANAFVTVLNEKLDSIVTNGKGTLLLAVEEMVSAAEFILFTEWFRATTSDGSSWKIEHRL